MLYCFSFEVCYTFPYFWMSRFLFHWMLESLVWRFILANSLTFALNIGVCNQSFINCYDIFKERSLRGILSSLQVVPQNENYFLTQSNIKNLEGNNQQTFFPRWNTLTINPFPSVDVFIRLYRKCLFQKRPKTS